MNIRKDLINKINKSIDDLDFITARRYIEENVDFFIQNQIFLNGNARDLLNFITERIDSGIEPLKRYDLSIINAINVSASKFDVSRLKILIKDHAQLLLRKDINDYLNLDAKVILEGLGAIDHIPSS